MTRGKPLSFDRQEVLHRAMDIFWEKGFAKTGMTELLDHMGIQRQSFYNTFGSKEEIFLEAVKLYSQLMLNRIAAILDQDRHPYENLEELFKMWEDMSRTKEGCGCMMSNTLAEFGSFHTTVSRVMAEQVSRLHEIYLSAFSKAAEQGYLSVNLDIKALATTFLALTEGMALLSKLGYGREMLDDVLSLYKGLMKA